MTEGTGECRCWNEGQWGRVHREDCPLHGPDPADAPGVFGKPEPDADEGDFNNEFTIAPGRRLIPESQQQDEGERRDDPYLCQRCAKFYPYLDLMGSPECECGGTQFWPAPKDRMLLAILAHRRSELQRLQGELDRERATCRRLSRWLDKWRDKAIKRQAQIRRLQGELDEALSCGLHEHRDALRAAPMPYRESTLGEKWDDAYDKWWHENASEAALSPTPDSGGHVCNPERPCEPNDHLCSNYRPHKEG